MGTRITPRRLYTAAAVLALAAVVVASGQERPPQPPPPPPQAPDAVPDQQVFRAGINFVRVDVIVTDREGNPVTDLTQDDFEVSEDNKPQTVEAFRLVKIDATTVPVFAPRGLRTRNDEETAAADENSRIFVFFLDDYHVRRENSMSVRRPLMEFIANQLSPSDLLGVMYPLTPIDAVVLTRNHQGVLNAVERFEGRKFDYEPKNGIEQAYVYRFTPDVIERIRRQVSLTALRGLSTKLGSLREGRKSLILVSEGYMALLPPQMRSDQPGGSGDPGRATRDPFAADNSQLEDRANFSASMDLQEELQDVFDAANRNNTSIYALDPRGLATGNFDITANISMTTSQASLNATIDTLRSLAENTDGRAIVNRNDLGGGLKQIVRDSSAYYLVGYNSTQAPTDGKFHTIKVRVKRPGVQVRARRGYWAYTEADVRRAAAGPASTTGPPTEVTKALAAIAPMTNRRYIRTWIGTGSGAEGKTKVTLLWEPLPATPGSRREEPRRVSLLATTPAGDVVYRGRLPVGLAAPGSGAAVSFDVPPGALEMRLTIEGDGTGTLDTETRDLVVPDLLAPEVIIGTPRVWFAQNAREFAALAADAAVPPAARRDFRRTDRLLVRMDVFAPGTSPPRVTAQLLNQQGTKMLDIAVAPPANPAEPHVFDLSLASLAAGQYLLELRASAEGHQPVVELLAFRVSS